MNMKLKTLFAAAFAVVGFCSTASAVTYPLPTDGSRLVGQNQVITIPEGNTQPLEYFAAEYQMGLSNMMEANPGVDTFLPKGGTVLNIPQQLILPDTVHEGIVINSAEMRLYYYPKGTNTVIVLPIGIGQLGKDTPINWTTKVERKKAGPTWTPTAKMHAEYRAAGEPLPAVVPAGPDNPMGLYALYIGRLYAIHGTNANFGIGLLVVTGGEAVVEAARKHTNKRLIAAGAGNPPVVVDETADLARAAQSIVKGASFDNNIICADEKVLIVVDSVADELMRLMEGQHAVKLTAEQAQQLQPVLLKNIDERGKGTVSRDWVGRDAGKIAAAIGLKVPQETRLLFVETTAEHPFAVTELMMPVLPVVRVANVADAIALAVKLEGGCHHTAAMHSRNIENMNQMANAIDTSIFVKNGPCIAGLGLGGEGWTTMTITTPTGEGVTSARTFVRLRRCVLVDAFRIV